MSRLRTGFARVAFVGFAILLVSTRGFADEKQPPDLDVPFEPTHVEVVEAMLQLADVTSDDYVIDLGCGDGRIVISAAKKLQAQGLGVDIDQQRIREAKDNAAFEEVDHLVDFSVGDIMDTPIHRASVVTLYLLNSINLKVRPKLLRELEPGTRVVSHAFHMEEWEPDRIVHLPKARNKTLYLWVIPARIGGLWECTTATPQGDLLTTFRLSQEFQGLMGTVSASVMHSGISQTHRTAGSEFHSMALTGATINGKTVTLTVGAVMAGEPIKVRYSGTAEGHVIKGTQEWLGGRFAGKRPWIAKQQAVDICGTWQMTSRACPRCEGMLYVDGTEDMLTAHYRGKSSASMNVEVPFYCWGSSIRFTCAGASVPAVFTGLLDQKCGEGIIYLRGQSESPRWFARRISRELPMELRAQFSKHQNRRSEVTVAVYLPAGGTEQTELNPPAVGNDELTTQGAGSRNRLNMSVTGDSMSLVQRQDSIRRWTPDMGTPLPGDEYVNPTDGSVLVWIPGGDFVMGSDAGHEDEEPAHNISISGFWLGKFEVTNCQYAEFLKTDRANPPYYWDNPDYNQADRPVVGLTWQEAKEYVEWAGLRLPTEAEWEYAAYGGRQREPGSTMGGADQFPGNWRGTVGEDRWERTSPVGSFLPNSFGVYDLVGNAWEWTSSLFAPYPYQQDDGREDPEERGLRVMRGGAWGFPVDYCRTTHRHRFAAHLRCEYSGIRVATTVVPTCKRDMAEKAELP